MTSTGRRTALLTAHIAATVGLLGADLALLALGIAGARGADPQTVYPAAQLITDAERLRFAIAPAAAATLLALSIALATFKPRWRVGTVSMFSRREG